MDKETKNTEEATKKAKDFIKAAFKGSMDVLSGKKESSVLNYMVIGFRILGVLIFIFAIFKWWIFEYIAYVVGYPKNIFTGLFIGILVFSIGELINLFIKIEGHLRIMSGQKKE